MTQQIIIRRCYPGLASPCQWWRFNNPVKILLAHQLSDVLPVIKELQQWVNKHAYYAVGWLSYEASPAFNPHFRVQPQSSSFPLAYFSIHKNYQVLKELPSPPNQPLVDDWQSDTCFKEFQQTIDYIQQQIKAGNTYQVNYSYRLKLHQGLDGWQRFLQFNQPKAFPYAAFIETDAWQIVSNSPELLFNLDGYQLTSMPMKGTVKRGLTNQQDRAYQNWLANSSKDLAENLMILDMARNDIGQIAQPASVKTPSPFEIKAFPNVWQMVSTVQAETKANLDEILTALFPAASITGAPKAETMKIISQIEKSPRQIYTGSIGFLGPERQAQFNVAIRTLVYDKTQKISCYGVGGGITIDSTASNEFRETQAKSAILRQPQRMIQLFETCRIEQAQIKLLRLHLQRLQDSAQFFGLACDLEQLTERIHSWLLSLDTNTLYRGKITLTEKGHIQCTQAPYQLKLRHQATVSDQPIHSNHPYLYHKTNQRQVYQQQQQQLRYNPVDDIILVNQNGHITEGCLSNVIIKHNQQLITPPQQDGLLNGVYRQYLLDEGELQQQSISLKRLYQAEQVYLCNALRGIWPVELKPLRKGT